MFPECFPFAILRRRWLCLALAVFTVLPAPASAAEEVIELEPFRVTAYHGDVPIFDGFTAKRYEGTNKLVTKFAQSLNKLLLGYHKKLVLDEVKHLGYRIKLGKVFEQEMAALMASFDFDPFKLDRSNWLSRERAIVTRLTREPFFKVKALVVWDLDRLNEMAPQKPNSKYARDIRFNQETGRWERRVTERWDVFFRNNPARPESAFETEKLQGLNLDTQRGFHFIERGLPANVPSSAFKDVTLSYPIFFSAHQDLEQELRRLQTTFVANLYYIYDPFSWVARRDVRFRGGFLQDCQDHIKSQRILVDDREWFDAVLARFLSDVVTIKLQGADEIYSLHMLQKRLNESPRTLGVGLDLLNWNKGETLTAVDRPEAEARITPSHQSGYRYVLIDAYQRFGASFLTALSNRLKAQKETSQRINGRALLTQLIEEHSGLPYDQFTRRAKTTQEAHLAQHKLTQPRTAQATTDTPEP